MTRIVVAAMLAILAFGRDVGPMAGDPDVSDSGPFGPDGGPEPDEGPSLRINHVQMGATVNSYHESLSPGIPELSYDHPVLAEQADRQGIRIFDFDVSGDRMSFMAISPATEEHIADRWNNCSAIGDPQGSLNSCLRNLRAWADARTR